MFFLLHKQYNQVLWSNKKYSGKKDKSLGRPKLVSERTKRILTRTFKNSRTNVAEKNNEAGLNI